mgnify:CR=1 FL=1
MEKRQFKVMLPDDVKDWLAIEAKRNLRSQTQELVLALREKMEAQEAEASVTK